MLATQHIMLVMEMKAARKRMSTTVRTKRTRWWKLNEEELTVALISKAREHLCSLEAEGKETNWKETYFRIVQLAKDNWESQHRESTWRKSHGGGMMQYSRWCLRKGGCSENGGGMMQYNRWCLRKGGCSENGKEREKKTIRRVTGRQTM